MDDPAEVVREALPGPATGYFAGPNPHEALDSILAERDRLRRTVIEMTNEDVTVQYLDDLRAERDEWRMQAQSLVEANGKLTAERDEAVAKAEGWEAAYNGDDAILEGLRAENDQLRKALEEIRRTVGDGAADIVTANTLLGHIDRLGRNALHQQEKP